MIEDILTKPATNIMTFNSFMFAVWIFFCWNDQIEMWVLRFISIVLSFIFDLFNFYFCEPANHIAECMSCDLISDWMNFHFHDRSLWSSYRINFQPFRMRIYQNLSQVSCIIHMCDQQTSDDHSQNARVDGAGRWSDPHSVSELWYETELWSDLISDHVTVFVSVMSLLTHLRATTCRLRTQVLFPMMFDAVHWYRPDVLVLMFLSVPASDLRTAPSVILYISFICTFNTHFRFQWRK